jgi:hypothetical protein
LSDLLLSFNLTCPQKPENELVGPEKCSNEFRFHGISREGPFFHPVQFVNPGTAWQDTGLCSEQTFCGKPAWMGFCLVLLCPLS